MRDTQIILKNFLDSLREIDLEVIARTLGEFDNDSMQVDSIECDDE